MSKHREPLSVRQAEVAESLRVKFEVSISDRVNRYLEIEPHEIVASHYFSPVSAECTSLYTDGYHYGAIAMAQSVAEALVRFMCERSGWNPGKVFEKNLETLLKRGVIDQDLVDVFARIWSHRNDYHHLKLTIETDRKKLNDLARQKLQAVQTVESVVFDFTVADGKLIPTHPEYWDGGDGRLNVILRLEP